MKNKFVTIQDMDTLTCPQCAFDHMRHTELQDFRRDEDADRVRMTVVDDKVVSTFEINNDISGNPSTRRHGLAIKFVCEDGHEQYLTIAQHKGQTRMIWAYPEGK